MRHNRERKNVSVSEVLSLAVQTLRDPECKIPACFCLEIQRQPAGTSLTLWYRAKDQTESMCSKGDQTSQPTMWSDQFLPTGIVNQKTVALQRQTMENSTDGMKNRHIYVFPDTGRNTLMWHLNHPVKIKWLNLFVSTEDIHNSYMQLHLLCHFINYVTNGVTIKMHLKYIWSAFHLYWKYITVNALMQSVEVRLSSSQWTAI